MHSSREFNRGSPALRASRLSLFADEEPSLADGDGSLFTTVIFLRQYAGCNFSSLVYFSGAAGFIAAIKQKSLSRAYSTNTGADGDISFNRPRIPETNERVIDSVLETFLNGYYHFINCYVSTKIDACTTGSGKKGD